MVYSPSRMKFPRFILLSAVALSPLVIAAEKPEAATNGSNKSSEKTAESPAKPMDKENLKKKLTPLQFEVACNAATEPPFRNAYWDNKRTGLYVDVWVTRDGRTKVYSTLARNEREADYLVDLWTKCQENA